MIASWAHPTFSPFSINLQLNSRSSVKQVAPQPSSFNISKSTAKPVPPIWLDSPTFDLASWYILFWVQKAIEYEADIHESFGFLLSM